MNMTRRRAIAMIAILPIAGLIENAPPADRASLERDPGTELRTQSWLELVRIWQKAPNESRKELAFREAYKVARRSGLMGVIRIRELDRELGIDA